MDADSPDERARLRRKASSQALYLMKLRDSLGEGAVSAATGRKRAGRGAAVEDLGFARVDHAREARKGFPEVVYGEGKTPEQIAGITGRILARSGRILITRVSAAVYEFLKARHPELRYQAAARAVYHAGTLSLQASKAMRKGHVLVICAGTTDLPVAEEAALTARLLGCRVKVIRDVGVAGLHRLLAELPALRRASVIVTVAGMEGALPSVVAGLVDRPVIGVPTSVGYGASMKGMAALLALLNSCAPGLTVVNIDNGFGAGFAAAQILRLAQGSAGKPSRKTAGG